MAVTGVLDYILKELDHVCITGVAKLPVQAIDLHDFYSSSINGKFFFKNSFIYANLFIF